MITSEVESTGTSRGRLLAAAKTLFARVGYEQASTAAIARAALSSESQLVRYFGGKSGLLAAIFDESWGPLNDRVQIAVADAATAREAVLSVLSLLGTAFAEDPELAFLYLFEGRRVRGESDVALTKGLVEFTGMFERLVRRGQKDGSFPADLSAVAVTAALVGACEALLRERVVAARSGRSEQFGDAEASQVLEAMVRGLSFPAAPNED